MHPKPEPHPVEAEDFWNQGITDHAPAIERMAGLGMTATDIGYILGIPGPTVEKDYAEVMRVGQSKANYRVANALFMTATDRTHRAHATCAIYWSKARMGWAETAARAAEDVPDVAGTSADASHLTDEAVKDRFAETLDALRNAG